MPTTLQEFASHSIWPYVIICLIYIVLKYIALFIAVCIVIKRHKNAVSPEDSDGYKSSIHTHIHKIVLHCFGRSAEKLTTKLNATDTGQDQEVHLHSGTEKALYDEHAMILIVHCISVVSITIVIVLKMLWMNIITHACTTDRNIHCFPQILSEKDSHLVPNISLQARTNDCSLWTHESFLDRITFICFEFTHSIEGAIVALGGVLSLFTPTMNVIIRVLHKLYKWTNTDRCFCNCGKGRFHVVYLILLSVGLLFLVIEIVLLLLFLVTGAMTTSSVDEFFMNTVSEMVATGFVNYGVVVLFIFGIITPSLLIPWNMYIK